MSVKLVVLYPQPTDPDEFERYYHGEHLPLMRRLVGPDVPLPTYRVRSQSGEDSNYYRVAEIHFADHAQFQAFLRCDPSGSGRASALKVSTGGVPTMLICERDAEPDGLAGLEQPT